MKKISLMSILLLTACVTINIYFPAAAAEQVADEIIKGIQSDESPDLNQKPETEPQSKAKGIQQVVFLWIDEALNILVSPAHAGADLSVNTAEIRQLRSAMQKRFGSLRPFYAKGIVGIKADGFITTKAAAPLKDKNKVNKLIAAENADRKRLYQAIANANGHPEWFPQIKATFAARWKGNAQSGWWFQTSPGNWKKK